MKLILLCGWSGSGKDATASVLVKNYGYKRFAFADQLKDIASEIYGFPRDMADTQAGKLNLWPCGFEKKTIRDLLIHVGKVERERFGYDIYVNGVIEQLKKLPENSKIVISDLRYPVELAQIKHFARQNEYRLEIWKIERDGQLESSVKDESEYLMEGFYIHRYIKNPGNSMEALEAEVETQIQQSGLEKEYGDECSIV